MHWGVRRYQNPDGTLTAAGKARYRISQKDVNKVQKIISNSDAFTDVSDEVFKVTKADKKYLKQAKNLIIQNGKRHQEISNEFDKMFKSVEDGSNTPESHYYQAVSEIANYGNSSWRTKDGIDDITIQDMADGSWMGIFEDGQQSKINAYSMYSYKNGLQTKVRALDKENRELGERTRKEAEKIVQTALDEVGGEKLLAFKKNDEYLASEQIVRQIINEKKYNKNSEGHYEDSSYVMNMAQDALEFTSKDKYNIKRVEEWAGKLNNNGDRNTWYLLNDAAENLGLSNKKASEMTQADWNKINKEIKKLRENGEGWD